MLARGLGIVGVTYLIAGCAVLHHAQIGDIDNREGKGKGQPFDIKVSETGFNLDEAASVAKAVARNSQASEDIESVRAIISLFQWGPRTGNPVFVEKYAEGILDLIYERCPSGKITGVMAIRESRKYPVIAGEIVKITGYCTG